MKISVLGDIMLSRLIGAKYEKTNYNIVSEDVKQKLRQSDYVIANLESPILDGEIDSDHLVFNAKKETLKQFDFVDFFSLANNHINDCGEKGIFDSIKALDDLDYDHNGIFREKYKPFVLEKYGQKFAIFTCSDMMNAPIKHSFKVPKISDRFILNLLKQYKEEGYVNIMYAHMGQLFTRYPNPLIREISRLYCDNGADVVLTVHPHVLGGIENYNGKKIIYSLGDFVMDGSSYRRRRSCIIDLNYNFEKKAFDNFKMTPTYVDKDLVTVFADSKHTKTAINSWEKITSQLNKIKYSKYPSKYKALYKCEILSHNLSTIKFIIENKGLKEFLRLFVYRFNEVKMMFKWIISDRTKLTKDDDAILENRKKITAKDLFNEK